MSNIRERLLSNNTENYSTIRNRLGLKDESYYNKSTQNSNSNKSLSTLKKEKDNKYQTYLGNKTELANTLNKEGLNVSTNNPFQANVVSNKLIDESRKNLSGIVSLNDVIENQKQALENNKELVNKVNNSMYDYAKSNYMYNEKKVASEDVNLYDKTIGTAIRGVGDLFSNFSTPSSYMIDENGKKIKAPTYNELKQNKVSESYNTGIGKFLGDTTYNMSKILGSQALNVVTGGVGGTTLYWSDMFLDNYQSSLRDGYDTNNAIAYALASTGAEYITGKFLGSTTEKLTGGKTNDYEQLLDKLFSKFVSNKTLLTFLSKAGSEATEEFIQEYLENINKLAFLDNSTDINDYKDVFNKDTAVDALYSAGVGALSGGALGVVNQKLYGNTPDTNSVVEDISKNVNEIEDINSSINDVNTNINSNINNQSNINSVNTNIDTLISQINEYQELQKQNKLTKNQEVELKKLQEQLKNIQNQIQSKNVSDITSVNENNSNQYSVPTVQDIVNMENRQSSNVDIPIFNNTNSNVELSLKEQQNNIIQNSNPVGDDYHTWIRSADDIKTFEETLNDSDYKEYFEAGEDFDETYTAEMAKKALDTGKIIVYSSYSIEQGTFVSPSKMEAESYSANGKVYSKEVSLTDIAWIDPTQGQYAKVSSKIAPVIDTTSVNNTNTALAPVDVSQIKQSKGNIPINQELLNKYSTAKEIFDNEGNNYNGKVNVETNIPELNDIDISTLKSKETKELAYEIFKKYNSKSVFENDGNKITVSKSGINESVEKIFNNKEQRNLLKEHLQVFSDLGDIIEHATLVNQTRETKNRGNINSWNYYFDGLNIDGELYYLEFDVRSLDSGENQYRVQRLQKKQTTHSGDVSNNTKILPAFGQSAFYDNNIPQTNTNVKSNSTLSTINNMQNNENNTSNLAPTKEYFESKVNNKTLNPNEISQLKLEDANTTPILPKTLNKNKVQDGESHFAKNIKDKTNMLTQDQKAEILSKEEVRYYDKVTNRESLEKAFEKLNNGGSAEALRWFKQDSKNVDATDVAEGWILMKQYSDNGNYDSMVEVVKKMRELGTIAGQTVQAFNIMERMTPEGMVKYAQSELSEAYDKMIKNKSKEWIDKHREDFDLKPNEVKFIMDTMNEVQNMEDGYDKKVKLAEIQKLMTDKLPPQKGAGIKSWMRISMLFNPKTQVRNVAGNALIMPVNSFGDLFSSYADKLISKKTGVRTTGNTNIKAMLKGIKKGAYEATNDYKKGINTKDMDGNRFEISDGKSFNDKKLIGKALNRTESLLNYVMDVGDRVFSEAAFENSLQNQMVLNNTTEITQEMIDIAHQEALSRTWNDNNNYTRFVLNARAGLNNLGSFNGYGLGDVLIPFAKTPANLTKAIVDYSPAGLVETIKKGVNLKRALSNGQYTASMQHDFVQSLGKTTAGTMLYVLGVALAKAGITSGDSDDDKDTANFLKNTLGVSSYSIKIGNKSFAYDWAQPIAAPLSITANIVNKKYQNKSDKELLSLIIDSLDTGGSILLEQSFLQSINDVLSDNDGVASGIIKEVLELPARAVPTFSKQIADLVDGTQRTSFEYGKPIKSAVNSIVAKIPFASKTLAPSVDTMGREIQKYGGKNNIFNVFLNPANVNTDNISKFAEEIYRLYKETGETSVMPRVAPYYINQKGEKITMTNEQRVNYQKTSGKIIEESIEKLLKSSSYSEMSDKEKSEVITDIVNYSYNIAKNEVLGIELSDTYQKAYDYSKIGDIGDYYTFKERIDDTDTDTKRSSITNFLINSDLNDDQLAFLYGNYYSSENVLDNLLMTNIPIKEFIKYNSQTFESDYDNNGKAISNSRKKKVINYINSLNLTIPQKAILIKMNYSSYTDYDSRIINYINNQNITISEKEKILNDLGFKIRNGKVYSK